MTDAHDPGVPTPDIAPPPEPRPLLPERRRAGWREFVRAYPGVVVAMALAVVALLALDGWVIAKRRRYVREIAVLRAGMSVAERRKADMLGAESENRLRVMLELVRRQAALDRALHVSVATDSAMMYLEQDGALLREIPVEVGPERVVGAPPDTVRMVRPRGARTITRILGADSTWEVPRWVYEARGVAVPADRVLKGALGPAALVLDGGTVVYTMPTVGPLNDSSFVMPGSVRLREKDLTAIVPDLTPGIKVYFY